jgi:ARID/BRIGHT DNA binding domain
MQNLQQSQRPQQQQQQSSMYNIKISDEQHYQQALSNQAEFNVDMEKPHDIAPTTMGYNQTLSQNFQNFQQFPRGQQYSTVHSGFGFGPHAIESADSIQPIEVQNHAPQRQQSQYNGYPAVQPHYYQVAQPQEHVLYRTTNSQNSEDLIFNESHSRSNSIAINSQNPITSPMNRHINANITNGVPYLQKAIQLIIPQFSEWFNSKKSTEVSERVNKVTENITAVTSKEHVRASRTNIPIIPDNVDFQSDPFMQVFTMVVKANNLSNRAPMICGRLLDYKEFFFTVLELGGSSNIITSKQWREVGNMMGFVGSNSNVPSLLKKNFNMYLSPIELILNASIAGKNITIPSPKTFQVSPLSNSHVADCFAQKFSDDLSSKNEAANGSETV